MDTLKILILEDDPLIAESILFNLTELGYNALEPVFTISDALELLQSSSPDFAILDINIDGKQAGFEVGEFINQNLNIPFIYLTGNSDKDSIDKASKTNPQSYLIKPFSKADLYSAIQIAISNFKIKSATAATVDEVKLQPKSMFIKVGNKSIKVEFKNIYYIISDDKYLDVYTQSGVYTIRSSMEKFQASLTPSHFIRVHRSYTINLNHSTELIGEFITTADTKIPVGRIYRDNLLKIISAFQ